MSERKPVIIAIAVGSLALAANLRRRGGRHLRLLRRRPKRRLYASSA